MQIEDSLERFVIQLRADGRSAHTVAQYGRHVRLFARWWRDVRRCDAIEAVSHEDVAAFLASNTARRRAPGGIKKAASMNCLRISLRIFFRFAYQGGYTPTDPGRLVRQARCGSPPPRALSPDEERRLLGTLAADRTPEGRRDHALFHLMLATGIRLGSVVAIDVRDVNLERGEIALRTSKGDRPETVYLGRKIRRHLARYLKGRVAGPLFAGRCGGPLSRRHVHRRLTQWLERAGITRRISPHTLRHSFALRIYKKTGDLGLVQAALHHRSIQATVVYARVDGERLRRAMG